MKKQHIEVEKRLLIKASIFFVLILITAFFVGIVVGRHGAPVSEILPEDEMRDSLDACKYEVQDVLHKYNAKASALSQCLAKKEKATPVKSEESPQSRRGRGLSRPAVEKAAPVEPVKNPSVSKLPAPLDKGEQLGKVEKVEKVEPVPPPVKKHKKCLYAIQLFSDTSKDNARKALSRMTDIIARLETATVRERTWYRIRYGCYTNKKEALEALQTIKERYEKAIIVAH